MPSSYRASDGPFRTLSPSVTFDLQDDAAESEILRMAIKRYLPVIFSHGTNDASEAMNSTSDVSLIRINVQDASGLYPSLNTDESYSLIVPEAAGKESEEGGSEGHVVIKAVTV